MLLVFFSETFFNFYIILHLTFEDALFFFKQKHFSGYNIILCALDVTCPATSHSLGMDNTEDFAQSPDMTTEQQYRNEFNSVAESEDRYMGDMGKYC